jgi:SAM-dependent methyltransferase
MSEGFYQPPESFRFDDLEQSYRHDLPGDKSTAILDVGCGHGRMLAFLSERGYTNLRGVDRDEDVLKWAAANVTPNVEAVSDLSAYLARHEGEFGLIVLKDVLFYVPKSDVPALLSGVGKAIAPGGRVLLETFNGAAWTGPYIAYKDPDIQWIPTETLLRYYLESAGFSDIELRGRATTITGLKSRIFSAAQAMWRMGLRLIYLLERGVDSQNPRILTTRIIASARR